MTTFLRRMPRPTFELFGRHRPSWTIMSLLGALAGLVTLWLTLPSDGTALFLAIVFANWGAHEAVKRIDHWRAKHRRLVLIHHLGACGLAAALVAAALGENVLETLDAWMPAMLVLLAFGRVGCFVAGCCYGSVATWGTWYTFRAIGPLRKRAGEHISVVPVQLIEAVVLVVTAGMTIATAGGDGPGRAFVLCLATYCVTRIVTELVRGDPRPYWGPLSQAQWQSLLMIGAAAMLWPEAALAAATLSLATLALAAPLGRLRPPQVVVFHESSLRRLRDSCRDNPRAIATLRGTAVRKLARSLVSYEVLPNDASSSITSEMSSISDSRSENFDSSA